MTAWGVLELLDKQPTGTFMTHPTLVVFVKLEGGGWRNVRDNVIFTPDMLSRMLTTDRMIGLS